MCWVITTLWTLEWARSRIAPDIWLEQGGQATVDGYSQGMPASHQKMLAKAYQYYILDKRVFVHAGILVDMELEYQGQDIFLWDRSLCRLALNLKENGDEKKARRIRRDICRAYSNYPLGLF